MEVNLVFEGIKFMVLGMGTVFLFLIIMIASMNAMSSLISRFFPEPQAKIEKTDTPSQQNNKQIIAAITAAIIHHRQS